MTQPSTEQEIFDHVWHFMKKQGRQSVSNDDICLYRGPDGTKCAVGCLLEDDEYDKEMNHQTVRSLLLLGKFPKRLTPFKDFLIDIQSAHDRASVDFWGESSVDFWGEFSEAARAVARKYGLTVPEE